MISSIEEVWARLLRALNELGLGEGGCSTALGSFFHGVGAYTSFSACFILGSSVRHGPPMD